MLRKLWKWIKSPFRVAVVNQPYEGDIVSMCSWRGEALIAMRDGTIYLAAYDLQTDTPVFKDVAKLRCR